MLIAVTSTTPRTENVILHTDPTSWYGKLFIGTAIGGTGITRFWAMERFFDLFFDQESTSEKIAAVMERTYEQLQLLPPSLALSIISLEVEKKDQLPLQEAFLISLDNA